MSSQNITVKQSSILLIFQLLALEGLVSLLGLLFKLPLISGWVNSLGVYLLITFIFQIVNAVLILILALKWANIEYRLENGSLVIRRGIVNIREKTYALDNVETIEVQQGLMERIFGYGTIHVYSPLFQEHIYIWGIPNPHKFAGEIKHYIPTGTRISVAPKR